MTDLAKEKMDLAAEYALGVLTGEDRRRAHALVIADDEFRSEVERWAERLAPLLEEVHEVSPPASVWKRISSHIGGSSGDDNVINLRRSIGRWRAISAGMTALAACLAILLVTPLANQARAPAPRHIREATPPLVAMLGAPEHGTAVVASWDPTANQLVLAVPGDLDADARHAHELWVIPKGGKPRSLGTMPRTRQMHMRLAETLARLLEQGATIAISVEPAGGSPTGSPTGPVVAAGPLTQA